MATLNLGRETGIHANKVTQTSVSALRGVTAFKAVGSLTVATPSLAEGKWHTAEGIYRIWVNVVRARSVTVEYSILR